MFNIDKIIDEVNKKMMYGDKPKVPEKINILNDFGNDNERKIINELNKTREKLNEIIKYLEWMDK